MKRRLFLASTGTIGAFGAVSAMSVASSIYENLSEATSLSEFSPVLERVLDKFISEVTTNIDHNNLSRELVANIATPIHIVKKEINQHHHQIIYLNREGTLIELNYKNGKEAITIKKSI